MVYHGNAREVAPIRKRLRKQGLKFCPCCGLVKSMVKSFALRTDGKAADGYQGKCIACTKQRLAGRKFERVACPERTSERSQRYRARDPQLHRDRCTARYEDRKAQGMSPYEASYQHARI